MAYMLKQPIAGKFIYYQEANMPWPVKVREGIYHLKINYNIINCKSDITGSVDKRQYFTHCQHQSELADKGPFETFKSLAVLLKN